MRYQYIKLYSKEPKERPFISDEKIYFFEWVYDPGTVTFGMHGTESEFNARLVLDPHKDEVRLVTKRELPYEIVT